MKANTILKYTLVAALASVCLVSCVSSGDNTGIEYAPNMYISQAYEPFSQEKNFDYNPNGMTMRLPVNGTVARGQSTFIYSNANNPEGYETSSSYLPWVAATKENVAEGQRLYDIYCWHCHGKTGKNDGPIFKSGKFPAPPWPNYQGEYIQNLPVGKAYHTITYGKGLMGSHAFMLDPEERWKVIHFVKSLAFGDDFEYSDATSTRSLNAEDGKLLPPNSSTNFPSTTEQKEVMTTDKSIEAAIMEGDITSNGSIKVNRRVDKAIYK